MVCEVCGKTMYWCLGHAPYRVDMPVTPRIAGFGPSERE